MFGHHGLGSGFTAGKMEATVLISTTAFIDFLLLVCYWVEGCSESAKHAPRSELEA